MAHWLPIIQRKGCPVLFYSYIIQGYNDAYHRELLGIPIGTNNHQYVDGWVVIDTEESARFEDVFAKRIAERTYVEFFSNQCERLSDELLVFGSSLRGRGFSDASPVDLLVLFAEFSSRTIRLMPFLTTMVLVQGVLEKSLKTELAEILQLPTESVELEATMQAALAYRARSPLAAQSIRDLRQLQACVEADHLDLQSIIGDDTEAVLQRLREASPGFLTKLLSYLDDYDFLGTDYYVGKPLQAADVLRQLVALGNRPSSWQNTETKTEVEISPALAPEVLEAASLTKRMHFLREHRIEALFKAGRDARCLFNEIASRIGVSYEEFLALTFSEVVDSLVSNNLVVPISVLQSRLRDYGVFMEAGRCRYVTDGDLETLRLALNIPRPTSTVLKGTTAYPGTSEGPACVIDRLSDASTIKRGDILIAPMTSPYHVPAMTLAGAVVTTEGGILSHAAILCRELKIPCIVGVSRAMDLISTGDRVRVIANPSQGTVQLLSGLNSRSNYANR